MSLIEKWEKYGSRLLTSVGILTLFGTLVLGIVEWRLRSPATLARVAEDPAFLGRIAKHLRPSVLFEFQEKAVTATILYDEGACTYVDCGAIVRRSIRVPTPSGSGTVSLEELEIAARVPLNTEPLLLAVDSGGMAIQARRGEGMKWLFRLESAQYIAAESQVLPLQQRFRLEVTGQPRLEAQ